MKHKEKNNKWTNKNQTRECETCETDNIKCTALNACVFGIQKEGEKRENGQKKYLKYKSQEFSKINGRHQMTTDPRS